MVTSINAFQCNEIIRCRFKLICVSLHNVEGESQSTSYSFHTACKTRTSASQNAVQFVTQHDIESLLYIYIYAFSRRFYPKRLTEHSGYTFLYKSNKSHKDPTTEP